MQACSDRSGSKPFGKLYTAEVTVGDWKWASAPVLYAEQLDPDEALVRISWTAQYGADGYEISDNKKTIVALVEAGDAAYSASEMLYSFELGAHYLYMRPYVYAFDGTTKIYGSYSKMKTIKIDIAWMKTKPVLVLKQTAEGEVTVSWQQIELAEGYDVFEMIGNQPVYRATVYAAEVNDFGMLECPIGGLEEGKHTFMVKAWRYNVAGIKDVGTASANKSITLVELWKAAPKLSGRQYDGDRVILTWYVENEAESYEVYGLVGKVYKLLATIEAGDSRYMNDDGSYCYITDPETMMMVAGKGYKFKVRPAKTNAEGVLKFGTYSNIVTVKMLEGWKVAPYLQSATQTGERQVTLVWEVADHAEYYCIYQKYNNRDHQDRDRGGGPGACGPDLQLHHQRPDLGHLYLPGGARQV